MVNVDLSLTLKHLQTCGAVLKAEIQAALDYSLRLKQIEAGLQSLVLWGKIITLNGKDYLVAQGNNVSTLAGSTVNCEPKYYYSQDGVKWVDLPAIDAQTAARCLRVKGQLSGDPAKNYELEEKDPHAVPSEDGEPPKPLVIQISEAAVLRFRTESVEADTAVIPAGCMVADAHNRVVINKLYAGCQYPDKLESYQHRTVAPGGPSLAADLRGTWSLHYDPFRAVSICRSLIWPGYFFYYSNNDLTWGSLYMGDGQRNNDLIFML